MQATTTTTTALPCCSRTVREHGTPAPAARSQAWALLRATVATGRREAPRPCPACGANLRSEQHANNLLALAREASEASEQARPSTRASGRDATGEHAPAYVPCACGEGRVRLAPGHAANLRRAPRNGKRGGVMLPTLAPCSRTGEAWVACASEQPREARRATTAQVVGTVRAMRRNMREYGATV